jgi:TolA-binding protein
MRSKVKISKRQIKEDKFTNFMLVTRDKILENWQVITIVAAAIIIVIVGTIYFANMKSTKSLEASNRLTRAIAEYRRQNYQVAILELTSISEEYSGRVAGLALFNLANAHFESNNYDEAMANFQKFLDDYDIDRLTKSSAIAGIGACLESKREFLAAGDKYQEAVDYYPESPSAPDYLLGAVRNYVLAGEREKMGQSLAELEEKYSGTDYAQTAARLAMKLKIQ